MKSAFALLVLGFVASMCVQFCSNHIDAPNPETRVNAAVARELR